MALAAIGLPVVFFLMFVSGRGQQILTPGTVLNSNSSFNLSGTVNELIPGVANSLVLTASNPNSVPITVTSVSVTVPSAPPGCPLSNLSINGTTFTTNSVTVGSLAKTVPAGGSATIPVSIRVAASADNNCQNVTFPFSYSGSATYTEPTKTTLTAAPNPATFGQTVTLTAAVAADVTPAFAAVQPVGAVTFYRCTAPTSLSAGSPATACTAKVALGAPVPVSPSGLATLAVSNLAVGTAPLFAQFAGTDQTDFGPSSSTVASQVVNKAPASIALTTAPTPSLFGQAVTLTAQLSPAAGPTGTVTFVRCATAACTSTTTVGTGALSGNGKATLSTSSLPPGQSLLRAVYPGDANHLAATSTTVTQTVNFTSACITGTVRGGLTVRSGQAICVGSSGQVNGGITVQAGGALVLDQARVTGGITATGASGLRICGATVNGTVTVSGATGFVLVGAGSNTASPSCAGNTLTSPTLSLTSNQGGFELGRNRVTGSVSVSANVATASGAAALVSANTISGSLACAATNNPAVTNGGLRNTVGGPRTGQCAGASF